MGLTNSSTGTQLLNKDFSSLKNENGYTVALAGNPNVGKSTIFNSLTGMHQHTGNWPGKTVANATGNINIKGKDFLLVDIPGTYSIMSNSEEEEIARNYICFGNPDVTVIVLDATNLERNLNLVYQIMEITNNIIVCVNLLDEAKKKKININLKELERLLGVPVVGTIARKNKTLEKLKNLIYDVCTRKIKINPNLIKYDDEIENYLEDIENQINQDAKIHNKLRRWIALKLIDGEENIIKTIENNFEIKFDNKLLINKLEEIKNKIGDNFKEKIISTIMERAEEVRKKVCNYENKDYGRRDQRIDKILTSKTFGIPIMILFLGIIFWITIVGANYPSQLLFNMFEFIQEKLYIFTDYINLPTWLSSLLIDGIYHTLTWIIAVMLPPMAIFFPLFTILEDLGYLPRVAFNMDGIFKKCCCTGKQMITMCMGFGCNAAGVVGCRIIDSPRERLIAILTNNFVPCNGRFPFLITISTIFIAGLYGGYGSSILSTIVVVFVIILGIFLTLLISKILSKTILKGMPSSFILELPPYRKPQFGKILLRSIFDRTLFVLARAIQVAAPAGLVIWLLANISIGGDNLLSIIANFLNPFAKLMGLDGYILTAFIIGIPANEIVLPIMLMSYLRGKVLINIEDINQIGNILLLNGWNLLTAINVMLFTLFHFPCATTLLTIKKETGKWKWTFLSFLIPTLCGIIICMFTTLIYNLVYFII